MRVIGRFRRTRNRDNETVEQLPVYTKNMTFSFIICNFLHPIKYIDTTSEINALKSDKV